MKSIISIAVVCAVSILAPETLADTNGADHPRFSHANFVDGKKAIGNLIKFPKTETDVDISVICAGHATAKGRLRNTLYSAANDPDLDFAMAVSRRFNSTRLKPATMDGKAQEVDFRFMDQPLDEQAHTGQTTTVRFVNCYFSNINKRMSP